MVCTQQKPISVSAFALQKFESCFLRGKDAILTLSECQLVSALIYVIGHPHALSGRLHPVTSLVCYDRMAAALFQATRHILQQRLVLGDPLCYHLLEGCSHDHHLSSLYAPLDHIPVRPFYGEVCRVLVAWKTELRFPVRFPSLELLPEIPEVGDVAARLHDLTPKVVDLVEAVLSKALPFDLICEELIQILQALAVDGVLRCLRLRRTFATLEAVCKHHCFPVDKGTLEDTFNTVYKGNLTAGARALAKHCHRETAGAFWGGELRGSEANKNSQANAVLRKLLDGAAWLNIHLLPHNHPCFEVRTHEGYGARWVYERVPAPSSGHVECLTPGAAADAGPCPMRGTPGTEMGGALCSAMEGSLSAAPEAAFPAAAPGTCPDTSGSPVDAPRGTPFGATDCSGDPCRGVLHPPAGLASIAAVAVGDIQRWNVTFRGFLEPPMPDGHDVGWRH